ncbi:MAG: glycosyltransferase [Clostridia bacterium]
MENFDFKNEPGKILNKRIYTHYDNKILISIITPYFNAEEYIHQTAFSILNQTFPFWEWIIVNDGSTNKNTEKVLLDIKKLDKRIKIINQDNGGPAKARYTGAKEAKADIIFTLDADDLIDKTMLECGYFSLLTNKDATWAYSSIATFGEENFLYNPLFDTFIEKKENVVSVASFIRKKEFLEISDYGLLPKEVHEDWYLWLSFLAKGYKPLKMNYYGFWYRKMNTGRLNNINNDKQKTKIAEHYLNIVRKKIFKKVKAIQFPVSSNYDYNTYPKEFKIDMPIIKKENKRILFIIPWSVIGGADIFNLNLIKYLVKNGYDVSIISTESCQYQFRAEFEKFVDEYFDLTTFLNRKDWAGFISHIIESRNIDIVFEANSFYGYYVIPWLKCKHPNVIFTDYLHAEDFSWRDGSYPRDSIAISRYLDKTFTCTNYLKELMYNRMNKKVQNTDVAYIGTNVEYFNPDIIFEDEKKLREKFKGKKIILFPCRIVFLKRPILLVEIIKKICANREDIICLVVGNGPAKSKMISKIKEYDLMEKFFFIDMKDDIRVYYKIADITLICSLTEGLTLTAYESMAFGVPVVTSGVGGQKELIDYKCGKVIKKYQTIEKDLHNYDYNQNEIIEYVDAIEEIIDSPKYYEMSKYCRNKIVNEFSLNVCMGKICNSLNLLIKNGSNVDKSICNNIEIAERYLILFNEYYKVWHYNPDHVNPRSNKQKIVDKLWNFRLYRYTIYVIKKIRNIVK